MGKPFKVRTWDPADMKKSLVGERRETSAESELASMKRYTERQDEDHAIQVNLGEILSRSREQMEFDLARERAKCVELEKAKSDLEHQIEVWRCKNEKLRFAVQDATTDMLKIPSVARVRRAKHNIEWLVGKEREAR